VTSAAAIPDEARCRGCNYSLRGLSHFRCPECGREFDPERPRTMKVGRPLDRFAPQLLRPMGRLPRVIMWALTVAGVIGPAWLVPSEDVACLWLLLLVAFYLACWVWSVLRKVVVHAHSQPRTLLRVDDPFRRRTRLAFLVAIVLVLTRAPFLFAILVSRPWLDSYAYHLWAEIPGTTPLPKGPFVRGAVVVREVEAGANGVTFEFYGSAKLGYVPTADRQRLRLDWWSWNPRWYFLLVTFPHSLIAISHSS
jgi:hypothetical protein